MGELKRYTGGCHCGKVRYEVTTDLERVIQCNCSICSKRSYLLHFVTADRFQLLSGEANVTDYQFNRKAVHHLFCASCGIGSYGHGLRPDGVQTFFVNARCLDDVDVTALSVTSFDGKSL